MVVYQVIKVAKAPLLACLTCPLCDKLVQEATTISECLHSFCRECIEHKFSSEATNDCPVCDVYLGCSPMDKLRADPQLDEVRNKLFSLSSSNKRKGAPFPTRRKERSLSSLGLSSLPSSSKRSNRKSKPNFTRGLTTTSSSDDKDEDTGGDAITYKRLRSAKSKDTEENGSRDKGKEVKQSALEYLADLANADASNLRRHQQTPVKQGIDEPTTRHTVRTSSSCRYGKLSRPTRGVVRRQPSKSQQDDQPEGDSSSHSSFVWLALKPAENQPEGPLALPQISTPYLKMNDGRVPISTLEKYLETKLDLKSDTEQLELICYGQKVSSSLPLDAVKSIWLDQPRQLHAAAEDHPASTAGSTSEQQQQLFMTLNYRRKAADDLAREE